MMYKSAFALLLLAVSFHSCLGIYGWKYCPNEKPKNPFCNSAKAQYKCSGWLVNSEEVLKGPKEKQLLKLKYSPLDHKWLGGVPDALQSDDVNNDKEIQASLGGISRKNFIISECEDRVGNARCFGAMRKAANKDMNSCGKTIYNTDGNTIVGDLFCQNINKGRWVLPSALEVGPFDIIFRQSSCGSEWADIDNSEPKKLANGRPNPEYEPLKSKFQVCCKRRRRGAKLRFANCDGTRVDRSCNTVVDESDLEGLFEEEK